MPHVIMIAGSNGSGKTTAAPTLLQGDLHVDNFVNADTIAQGLCAFHPDKAEIQAGRIMLQRLHTLAEEKANFAFETTLASRSFATWISKLKTQGYAFHLIFLWLNNVEISISRVQDRIKMGGHAVPEPTIRRRYVSGLKNFFGLYRTLTTSWQLYDNSHYNDPSLIAFGEAHEHLNIKNNILWQHLLEQYT